MSASSRMNQYERGKHTPGFFLIERLAQALHMPTPWFYTRDDDMAELLLAYHALPPELKEKALAYLKGLAGGDGAGDGMADGVAMADGAGNIAPADGHASADGGSPTRPPPGAATYSRSSPGRNLNRTPARPPSSDEQSRK
ncbi:hypothetical protein BAU08_20130 [Bordetella bronchialis]|uniref:HTH cro/C1-type domain-containing protein n=2 Tax=Bordetella bronchialis TaxID=463025 RepID=A0A193G0F3_9BORD|nr:hypothetical protein BAU08_20130 [Bordetella bronchialis]